MRKNLRRRARAFRPYSIRLSRARSAGSKANNRADQGIIRPCTSYWSGRRKKDPPQRRRDAEKTDLLAEDVQTARIDCCARSRADFLSRPLRILRVRRVEFFFSFSAFLRLCGESFFRAAANARRRANRAGSLFTMSKSASESATSWCARESDHCSNIGCVAALVTYILHVAENPGTFAMRCDGMFCSFLAT